MFVLTLDRSNKTKNTYIKQILLMMSVHMHTVAQVNTLDVGSLHSSLYTSYTSYSLKKNRRLSITISAK